jgi:hypothetical protein
MVCQLPRLIISVQVSVLFFLTMLDIKFLQIQYISLKLKIHIPGRFVIIFFN